VAAGLLGEDIRQLLLLAIDDFADAVRSVAALQGR
jgi:hypothetical protein